MSNKKQKKPFDFKKLPLIILGAAAYLIVCGGLGWMLGSFTDTAAGGNDALAFAYLMGALALLIAAFFVQIILHEAGHLVFGLLSGYQFVSFNVLGFIWQKGPDGKLHCGRMQIAGAGGQCLMSPPDYDEGRFPFTLYNLGGVIMNLVVSAVCLLLALITPQFPLLFLFLLELTLVGVFFALTNGLPIPVAAIQNDGTNLLCIRKDVHARRAFWVQMTIAAEITRGKRLKDMPDAWFAAYPEEAMENPIVSAIAVMNTSRLMDMLDFTAAEAAIRTLLAREKGLVGLYRMTMGCDGAVCELIAGRPDDLTESLSSKENQQLMKAMKTYPSMLRTQYAIALLRDRDADKAVALLADFEAAARKHPNPQEIIGERELLLAIQNAALNGGNAE